MKDDPPATVCRTPSSGAYEFGLGLRVEIGGPVGAPTLLPRYSGLSHLSSSSRTGAAWCRRVRPKYSISCGRRPATVNITIGLALTSFVLFEGEGFRRRSACAVYLGKFFPGRESSVMASARACWPCTWGHRTLPWSSVRSPSRSPCEPLRQHLRRPRWPLAVITALTLAIIPVTLVRS